MGRKAYIADVADAIAQTTPGITNVVKGTEDGDLHLCFTPSNGLPIEMSLLSLEVGGYPQENTYMITTESMDLPDGVNAILAEIQDSSAGKSIPDLIGTISRKLGKHLAAGSADDPFDLDEDEDMDFNEDDDPDGNASSSEEEAYAMDGDEEFYGQGRSHGTARGVAKAKLSPEIFRQINGRIKSDLRTVKLAGFKIGILCGAKADSISSVVSISVKVDKLGLSEEAIQAWDLDPQQYIVLLIRYNDGYHDFEQIMEAPAKALDIEFRVGVSNKYKPSLVAALAAFTDSINDHSKSSDNSTTNAAQETVEDKAGFSNVFISSSLNEFVNTSFISLLKIRNSVGLSWRGAKSWFNEKQSRIDVKDPELPSSSCNDGYNDDFVATEKNLPDMIARDHLTEEHPIAKPISFPLLAAQFTLRYFARCTEYCLVCHDETKQQFEALKPYVCSKPLCLYQYMSLGFGPSVEHEILTQPYVVDLLISFCYVAAQTNRLREYPTGMSLAVPLLPSTSFMHGVPVIYDSPQAAANAPAPSTVDLAKQLLKAKYDFELQEIVFDSDRNPVRPGDWIVLIHPGGTTLHYRVQDVSRFPTVALSSLGTIQQPGLPGTEMARLTHTPATTPPARQLVEVEVAVYDHNFDDMADPAKAQLIAMLLETLPTLRDMRAYLLQQQRIAEPNLRAWKEQVSSAALGLLRWIVASNRSCIVQVDSIPGQDAFEIPATKVRLEQKLSNVTERYVQFRFAQGAPDKEQRFLNALKDNRDKLNPLHPTLFAWHGSPLQNWHSIIRSGLDFKETLHGRAYGHGVYHAMDQNTSVGYAQVGARLWHGSELKISTAMSLNEIINAPTLFASSKPYLVVQHIDWIQCRYLLVQTAAGIVGASSSQLASVETSSLDSGHRPAEIVQDPAFTAKSTLAKPIGVPLCAITTSKAFRAQGGGNPPHSKKRKHTRATETHGIATASDTDEMEDIQFLLSDDEGDNGGVQGKSALTDFVPGSLDRASLPMLEPPSYATPMATKTLQRNLKEVLDIQSKTPIHKLGWYIDAELIDNFYQWIVELHTFDPESPLAKDMKLAGISSVVLEIRFGKDYPHSPPFVRVIRPRFLPFTMGGGGHVTAGGAMCMELLTNSGWTAVSSIESVLLQVRMAMMNPDPKPARLEARDREKQQDYGVWEAIEAYKRACAQHGWQVPPDFGDFASNGTLQGGVYQA